MKSFAPLALVLSLVLSVPSLHAATPAPPPTRTAVVVDTLHGIPVADPYRWLEDKDSPETRAWVREQMAFTQSELAKVPGRDEVIAALAKYTRVDTRSVPTVRGTRLFFTARTTDQQQPCLMMRETSTGPDVMLVDPNPLSSDHTTSVTLVSVSQDGRLLAYGLRKGGEDEVEVRLFDVDARHDVPGGMPKGRYYGVSFDKAKRGYYYARWSAEGPRVRYHRLTDDPSKDALVFGEGLGAATIPTPRVSPNGRWLLISVSVGSSGDDQRLYLKDLERNGAIVTVADVAKTVEIIASHTVVAEPSLQTENS